jgi:LacI family transcriptional regulator
MVNQYWSGSVNRNVTMQDIADRLGVSKVTVSKALNNKEGVGEELRLKIKKTAEEMGYRYNSCAKSVKYGLTYNIGVISPEKFTGTNSFYISFYKMISKELDRRGYSAILHTLSHEEEASLRLPRLYYECKADGLIILGQVGTRYAELLGSIDIPVVFLDFYDKHSEIDSVISDNFHAAYELTNYLIENGHREIAYIGNINATSSIQDRYLGYLKSLLENRITPNPDYVISDRLDDGTLTDIVLPERMPTAFVCNCDMVAYKIVNKLKQSGWRIPEDVSVVGFDDDIYATLTIPNLTTVQVNVAEMTSLAVNMIINKIRSNKSYGRIPVRGRIIIRDSVRTINRNQEAME